MNALKTGFEKEEQKRKEEPRFMISCGGCLLGYPDLDESFMELRTLKKRWEFVDGCNLESFISFGFDQVVFKDQQDPRKFDNLIINCDLYEQFLMDKLASTKSLKLQVQKDQKDMEARNELFKKTGLKKLPEFHPYDLELSKACDSSCLWLNGTNKETKVFYYKENYIELKVKEVIMFDVKLGITGEEMLKMFPNIVKLYVKDCDEQRCSDDLKQIKIEKM